MKNVAWKLVMGPLNFLKTYCKMESEEVCMMIWTNADTFAFTYLIQVPHFKNLIFQERLWFILWKHKRAWN